MHPLLIEEIDEVKVRALINRRIEATQKKDAATALSDYTSDVLSFDVIDPLQYRGSKSIRKRLEEWFSSFEGNIGLEIFDLKISCGVDVAFDHGLSHVHGTKKDGKEIDMWWRETVGLLKINGKWTITHMHSSVPFNVQSGKASLDLTPNYARLPAPTPSGT
jgi:ketosteroid isomerase-like protein